MMSLERNAILELKKISGLKPTSSSTKLQVSQGVVFTDNNNGSLVMRSPDKTYWIKRSIILGNYAQKKVPFPK